MRDYFAVGKREGKEKKKGGKGNERNGREGWEKKTRFFGYGLGQK